VSKVRRLSKWKEIFHFLTQRLSSEMGISTTMWLQAIDTFVNPKFENLAAFPTAFSPVSEPLTSNCYVKRPSLLWYGDTVASTDVSNLLLNEAQVCEILRANPHPNIAQYLGCVVENDRITGLCFVKYSMNLSEKVQREPQSLDVEIILRGIQWTNPDFNCAMPENDEYGLSKIEEFLFRMKNTNSV
jgi:hypothetical protein